MKHLASPVSSGRGIRFLLRLRATDPDARGREIVLRVSFLGTFFLSVAALLIVSLNYFVFGMTYLGTRLLIIVGVNLLIILLYALLLKQYFRITALSLLFFYYLGAVATMWEWGIEIPTGILLLALVVILSGILLGARYSLYALLIAVITQTSLVLLAEHGYQHPDLSWKIEPNHLSDVFVCASILSNIALISWLFNRSIGNALRRARKSERALRRQKKLLEIKVEERTREVQAVHLERMQELYRFAELGHIGASVLHDLSNYLTVLSFDIEDLKQDENRSVVVQHVQDTIHHLDQLVRQARRQIKGETSMTRFNIADEIDQVWTVLAPKAKAGHVQLQWKPLPDRTTLEHLGSVNHFWQIMTNVLSNAIDAYADMPADASYIVRVAAVVTHGQATITVTDFGSGIDATQMGRVFEPLYSTKRYGMGIGLAIVKQMIEKQFDGTISAASDAKNGTVFTITFPVGAN